MPNPFDQTNMGPTDQFGFGNQRDNQIAYSEMMQRQVTEQFQQQMRNSTPLTNQQLKLVTSNNSYMYGVESQNWKSQQRKNSMNRMNYSAGLVSGGTEFAIGTAAMVAATPFFTTAAMAAAGATPLLGPAAVMLAAPIVPMHFINQGVQRTLERQRMTQSIAGDLDSYRSSIGMPGMTYNEATGMGASLASSMSQRGSFFSGKQQESLFKSAISNNMLSAKTKGMITGDAKQFEKNVKELFEATEMIVKTMGTTLTGGLSIIKEMQGAGFGTMSSIRNSIVQAKGIGNMTGLGTQNILHMGATGASAVQGSTWTPGAGAAMYMGGAAAAGYMARSSYGNQQSVAQVGGVAAAGGVLANAQMNILKSGMGRWVGAYLMDSDGKLDTARLQRLKSGKVSGYEMTTVGSSNYYNMGISNNALFRRNQQDILNTLAESPETMGRTTMALFKAWGGIRGGNNKAQAQVFANQFLGGDTPEANLFADWASSPKSYSRMGDEMRAARTMSMTGKTVDTDLTNRMRAFKYNAFGGLIQGGTDMVTDINTGFENTGYAFSRAKFFAGRAAMGAVSWGLGGNSRKYGAFNRGNLGGTEEGVKRFYGVGTGGLSAGASAAYSKATSAQLQSIQMLNSDVNTGINGASVVTGMSRGELETVTKTMMTALGNGTARNMFRDNPEISRMMKLSETQMRQAESGGAAFVASSLKNIATAATSINSKSQAEVSYSARFLQSRLNNKNELNDIKLDAAYMESKDIVKYDKMLAARGNRIDSMTWKKFDEKAYQKEIGASDREYNTMMAWQGMKSSVQASKTASMDYTSIASKAAASKDSVEARAVKSGAISYLGLIDQYQYSEKFSLKNVAKGAINFTTGMFNRGRRNAIASAVGLTSGLDDRTIANRIASRAAGFDSEGNQTGSGLTIEEIVKLGQAGGLGTSNKERKRNMWLKPYDANSKYKVKDPKTGKYVKATGYYRGDEANPVSNDELVRMGKSMARTGATFLETMNTANTAEGKAYMVQAASGVVAMDNGIKYTKEQDDALVDFMGNKKGKLTSSMLGRLASAYDVSATSIQKEYDKAKGGEAGAGAVNAYLETIGRTHTVESYAKELNAMTSKGMGLFGGSVSSQQQQYIKNLPGAVFNGVKDEKGVLLSEMDNKARTAAVLRMGAAAVATDANARSAGKSIESSVNPPILNYWNNSWAY